MGRRNGKISNDGVRLITHGLAIAVLLFNIAGGLLVAGQRSGAVDEIDRPVFSSFLICGTASHDGRHHEGPFCPQCFPLGSVCNGALAPTLWHFSFVPIPAARLRPEPIRVEEPSRPDGPYAARAPPFPSLST